MRPNWWTPLLPVNFFLSSIVAGTAVVVLVEFAIARGWRRTLPMRPLAAMGQITFWSLLVYLVFRLSDMALRGWLIGAVRGTKRGGLFAIEIFLCGIVPLFLLGRKVPARASGHALPRHLPGRIRHRSEPR